ncbi:MAG: redox-sensing transcriptional repressor Rex [Selenomonadaceae bacterium]|nr:redox-sensing transcriptional repressor Rex [Selenomonadaceae bacterium]MBQ6758007.1 redox-sensing transcriptional repressor Rex [Selenomonadaceae bacterium]
MKKTISQATIDRLPLYFRTLRLVEAEAIDIISSDELGRRLDITPEQIRKDLATFGQFGRKGIGYDVRELRDRIENILGLHNKWRLAIVGMGHLGGALANYVNFAPLGFSVVALFDNDKEIIGSEVNGLEVNDASSMEKIISERSVDIGVITVPASEAQGVADSLIAAGVKGIWNFAPIKLNVPIDIPLVNEDLSVGLSALSYHMSQD